jgi:uncharacterized protein (TIGR03086 family)
MFDFEPATTEAARLLDGVRDEDLDNPSPCEKWPVATIVNHLTGLSGAFAAGAAKAPLPFEGAPPEPTPELSAAWRDELPRRLRALAAAWRDPAAWNGTTKVAGVDMPGEVCALVALDEVMVHSWDLAVATGQRLRVDPALAGVLLGFWAGQEGDTGDLPLRQVIFGGIVPVPASATVFDRVLGLTGRDPSWTAA